MKRVFVVVYTAFIALSFATTLQSCSQLGTIVKNSLKDPDQVRRENYVNSHPNLSAQVKSNILDNTVAPGMTEEDVIATWGNPYKTERNVNTYGSNDTWYYGEVKDYLGTKVFNAKFILMFTNGTLTSANQY